MAQAPALLPPVTLVAHEKLIIAAPEHPHPDSPLSKWPTATPEGWYQD
jgi:hypothetical protein